MSDCRHRLSAWMIEQDAETVQEVGEMIRFMGVEYTVSMLEQMGEDI